MLSQIPVAHIGAPGVRLRPALKRPQDPSGCSLSSCRSLSAWQLFAANLRSIALILRILHPDYQR